MKEGPHYTTALRSLLHKLAMTLDISILYISILYINILYHDTRFLLKTAFKSGLAGTL